MKIISAEVIPVNLPFKNCVNDSWGKYTSSNHGIVILTAEDGTTGIGEIAFAWHGGAHSLCADVARNWLPLIVGMEHTELTKLNLLLDSLCVFSKRSLLAKAGIEMAAWDLLGKTLGLPVHILLGGKMRETIPLTGGIVMAEAEVMAEEARLRVSEGYGELKLKVGLDDAVDLEGVRTVRKAIPDRIRLRADANMAWKTRKHAKAMMDELWELGVFIVEQPLPDENLTELHWLRENTKNMVLLDESVWDSKDALRVIQQGAADMLHVYTSEAGGLDESRKIFQLAKAASMDCTIGSMPEGAIGASASLHVAAAMPNLSSYPSDIRGHTAYAEDVTVSGLPVRDGMLKVPDSPGLGVELDMDKLASLRVDI